jgi:2-phosphosulfolactate phosphatase
MPRRVYVSLLPSLLDASRLAGGSAVVIDVLRASTTICTALAAGADRVIPFANVDDARRFGDQLAQTGDRPLLGGERGGVKIEGFDLGNSPLEYTRESVAGKTILFTTTNGTRALLAAAPAERVYIGAFANLTALVDRLMSEPQDVHLVCAGTDAQVTVEDVIYAGLLIVALYTRGKDLVLANDEALIASELGGRLGADARRLDALRKSHGGRNLVELGYDQDIEFSARLDSAPVVPVFTGGSLTVFTPEPASGSADAEWAI